MRSLIFSGLDFGKHGNSEFYNEVYAIRVVCAHHHRLDLERGDQRHIGNGGVLNWKSGATNDLVFSLDVGRQSHNIIGASRSNCRSKNCLQLERS